MYVTVSGDGFQNPETRANVALSEEWLRDLEHDLANPAPNLDVQSPCHPGDLERQIAETRAKLR